MIVHFLDMYNITDRTTYDVINYIAIEIRYPETRQNIVYVKSRFLQLITLIPFARKQTIS